MAGNRKPRKPHRQKKVSALPIVFGLKREMKTDLRLPYHLCLETLRAGRGGEQDCTTIFATLLTARELLPVFTDGSAVIHDALDAIAGVKERGDQGKWGVSGDQFTAISAALVLFDEMQDMATRREVRGALERVWNAAT